MNQNIGISELTTGVDRSGMESYIESLRLHLITEVFQDIDDVSAIEATINAGWQGVSKDRFLDQFKTMREQIKEDLQKEFINTTNRLYELQSNYFKQHENMMME